MLEIPPGFHGPFAGADGTLYAITTDAIALRRARGHLLVGRLVAIDAETIALRMLGIRRELRLAAEPDGDVTLTWTGEGPVRLRRLATEPPELAREPIAVAASEPVTQERVAALRSEIARRLARDQAVRPGARLDTPWTAVASDDAAWLRQVVAELGWVDAARFGRKASLGALTLLRHTLDLPLVRAVLPAIEADVRAGRMPPRPFAATTDRLLLQMGEPQRYGTQTGSPGDGRRYLFPIADRDRVDARRQALGLPPLAASLASVRTQHPDQELVELAE